MKFSLRGLGLVVAWFAVVLALVCQIRYEAMIPRWSSGVATDIIWVLNLFFTIVVVLIAIATRSNQKMFWIGCAVVAIGLFICQTTDQQPRSLARNVSVPLISIMIPEGHKIGDSPRESHIMELGTMLTFSLIPLLSLAGGSFANRIYDHSGNPDQD